MRAAQDQSLTANFPLKIWKLSGLEGMTFSLSGARAGLRIGMRVRRHGPGDSFWCGSSFLIGAHGIGRPRDWGGIRTRLGLPAECLLYSESLFRSHGLGLVAGGRWCCLRSTTRLRRSTGRYTSPLEKKEKSPSTRFARSGQIFLLKIWCGRVDSNHHGIATASPSSWCVCQFRHDRTEVRSIF